MEILKTGFQTFHVFRRLLDFNKSNISNHKRLLQLENCSWLCIIDFNVDDQSSILSEQLIFTRSYQEKIKTAGATSNPKEENNAKERLRKPVFLNVAIAAQLSSNTRTAVRN